MSVSQKTIKEIWANLRKQHSVMFSDKPLAVGVMKQIEAQHVEYKPEEIQAVLHNHTKTTTYLRNIKFGEVRYNLDGTEAGTITDQQRECARLKLNERNQKRTFTMIDKIKPAKTEKKRLARKARHANRLVNIQTKLKEAVKALKN